MNSIYELKLFKKNGSHPIDDEASANSDASGSSLVIGYFDKLQVKPCLSLSSIVSQTDNHFSSYSVYLFPLETSAPDKTESSGGGIETLLRAPAGDIYIISAFQLNELSFTQNNADDGFSMLLSVKEKIDRALGELALEEKEKFRYSVWGVLGSFELLLVSSAKELSTLTRVMQSLFPLRGSAACIDYSTSFFAVPAATDPALLSASKCHAMIRCAVYQLSTSQNEFEAKLFDILGDNDFKIYLTAGDDDVVIMLNSPFRSLYKLLQKNFEPLFRSTYSAISWAEISSSSVSPRATTPAVKNLLAGHREQADNFSHEMNVGLKAITPLIPESATDALNSLARICGCLLHSDYHHVTGTKMKKLIRAALANMSGRGKLLRESVCEFVNALSFYFSGCMKIDNVLLDKVDSIDRTSPISKMIISYEQMVQSVLDVIDTALLKTEGALHRNWEIFVTVSQAEVIRSTLFFPNIISFNLPNNSYLSVHKMLPFLLHEISHYVSLSSDPSDRNRALGKLFSGYMTVHVWEHIDKRRKSNVLTAADYDAEMSSIGAVVNKIIATAEQSVPCAENLSAERYVSKLSEEIRRLISHEISTNSPDKRADFYKIEFVLDAVMSVIERKKLFELANALMEARADAIALALGGYSLNDFINTMFNIITAEQMLDIRADEMFMLRMSAVISHYIQSSSSYKYTNEAQVSEQIEKLKKKDTEANSIDVRNGFHNVLYDYAQRTLDLVQPIVTYLRSSFANAGGAENLRLTKDNFGLDPCDIDSADEVRFHVNNWYRYVKNLIDKGTDENAV